MSSSATARKHPKSSPKTPKSRIVSNQSQSPSYSSTITSLLAEVEPPPDLLPSKSFEFLKLIVVIIIATLVAGFCNFLYGFFNHSLKPFCDSDGIDFDVSFPGNIQFFYFYFQFSPFYYKIFVVFLFFSLGCLYIYFQFGGKREFSKTIIYLQIIPL